MWVLSFNPQLLLENTKVETLFVPAQILWGRGFFHILTLGKCVHFGTSIWSGPMPGREAKRVGSRGQGGPWAAGVRTAGVGPEPD